MNDPYANTYDLSWRNHPNFSRKEKNPTNAQNQNHMHGQHFNQNMPHNAPNKPTLEDNLDSFIHVSIDNQERNNERLHSLEASMKRLKVQVGP